MDIQFSQHYLLLVLLVLYLKHLCQIQDHEDLSLCFLLRIILAFKFVYDAFLVFIYGVRKESNFILLHTDRLLSVKLILHSWDKYNLVIVYYFLKYIAGFDLLNFVRVFASVFRDMFICNLLLL